MPSSSPQRSPAKLGKNGTSTLPLSGASVFLHIRDAPGKSLTSTSQAPEKTKESAKSVKKECRTLVERLGATLTVSEAAASLVVAMNASSAFVDGCAAAGKAVVAPAYLRACAEEGRRVDVRGYLVEPAAMDTSSTRKRQSPGKKKSPAKTKTQSSPPRSAAHKSAAPLPSRPALASSAFLLDDESPENASAVPVRAAHSPERTFADMFTTTSAFPAEEVSSSSADTVTVTPPQSLALSPTPIVPQGGSLRDKQDELRHAVLRSTAAASARRRGRSPPHSSDGNGRTPVRPVADSEAASSSSARGRRSRQPPQDPFLSGDTPPTSESIAPHLSGRPAAAKHSADDAAAFRLEKLSLSTPSLAPSCSVTQPLSSSPTSTPQATIPPQQQQERRSRNEGKVAVGKSASATKAPKRIAAKKPAKVPSSAAQQPSASTAAAGARGGAKGKHTVVVVTPVENEEETHRTISAPRSTAPPILPMKFTEATQLRRVEGHPASDFRVALILRTSEGTSTSGAFDEEDDAQAAFLADVVEQLGGALVAVDHIFGRRRKPTHLVVDDKYTDVDQKSDQRGGDEDRGARDPAHERVGLTPAILLAKALGINIVRPQWLYDAIALGGFPEVLPETHLHPVFGIEQTRGASPPRKTAQEEEEERRVAEAVAAASACARQAREDEETAHDVLGEAVTPPPFRASSTPLAEDHEAPVHQDPSPLSPTPTTTFKAAGAGSSTMAFLAKTTRDEVLPVGQVWERPFYKPIFTGMDIFLNIRQKNSPTPGVSRTAAAHPRNPADPKKENTAAAHKKERKERLLRAHAHSPEAALLSSDEAEAFEQATELIRVLGGTVTRNQESHHLDVILDLYGFCPPAQRNVTMESGEDSEADNDALGHRSAEEEQEEEEEGTEAELIPGDVRTPHGRKRARGMRARGSAHAKRAVIAASSPASLPQSVVMESASSLSMAYQEALTRIESYSEQHLHHSLRQQVSGAHAVGVEQPLPLSNDEGSERCQREEASLSADNASHQAARQRHPTVGVPWLVHCILSRERSDLGPFLLENHASAPMHGDAPPPPTRVPRDVQRRKEPLLHTYANHVSPPQQRHQHQPQTPTPTADSLSADLYMMPSAALLAAKTTSGPAAAQKTAEQQLDTQHVHEVLDLE